MKAPEDREFSPDDLQKMGIYIHPTELESDIITEGENPVVFENDLETEE